MREARLILDKLNLLVKFLLAPFLFVLVVWD